MAPSDTPDGVGTAASGETKPERWGATRRLRLVVVSAIVIVLVLVTVIVVLVARDGDRNESASPGEPEVASADVRDLMTIVDDEGIRVEAHGDGTASVLINTTIEVVCAVSYGPTEELGFLATDTDMAGGGHSDHHPLLVNLEENSDYFYRLSGVGPEGELYTSELRRFTNGGHVAATPGPNIAPEGTVVDVSSEFSATFAAPLAIDGDRATEWSSAGDGDDAYIVIDLGEAVDLTGVGFRTREMSDGSSITTSFTVTIDDREPLGPFDAGLGLAVAEFEAFGRLVRIDVETSTGGNTGAVEIEVYGRATG